MTCGIVLSPILCRSLAILLVSNLFHPLDSFAVERFLNGDVSHGCRRRRAMPMFFPGSKPDHVARLDLFDRSAFALSPAEAGHNNERLSQWMRVPRGPR